MQNACRQANQSLALEGVGNNLLSLIVCCRKVEPTLRNHASVAEYSHQMPVSFRLPEEENRVFLILIQKTRGPGSRQ
jgi:hypothetical protein